ncbi:type II toxin-antitoxin system RelE/ParE family toxin [Marinomonas atlantica]|nr:type II toxin-antitoxin system RelE/ParE family toxin [Marinomonas atlantica]
MYNIKLTDEFDVWLNGLKDNITRLRLARRLEKASRGALGDVKSVGEGVFEMREHFGAGWRMYYVQQGDTIIIMLAGGDKSSQSRDIARAKQIAINLNEVRP